MASRDGKKSGFGRWWSVLAAAAAALAISAAALIVTAERKLSRLVVGGLGVSFSTKIYSAPFLIDAGSRQAPWRVVKRLELLGYHQAVTPSAPGEFSWSLPNLTVFVRGFASPLASQDSGIFVLESREGDRWNLRSSSGAPVGRVYLEPELMAELSGPERVLRDPARWDEIPENLRNAVVSAEDKRFYGHWGIDWRAVLRSLWYDVSRRGVWGGSTITQQLAKNLFLTPRRTLWRKAAEAGLAVYLELRYSKKNILLLYLNHIYLGQKGSQSVAGMRAAADFYFGKPLRDLDLAECAMLAGLIRSPYLYNPFRDPVAAKARRGFVLSRMAQEGAVTPAQRLRAQAEPLKLKPQEARPADPYAYFTAEAVRELLRRYPEDELFHYGLSIYTTADPLLQRAAVRAVRPGRHEAALVGMDASTGKVLALVGGRDFGVSSYNRATQARRQPGSAFKPFVYGAALKSGVTPATVLVDRPRKYARGSKIPGEWNPANYDGVYYGTATVRQALAHSLNSATLDLAQRLEPPKIIAFARLMGIQSPLSQGLDLALGTSEVGLLELTAAYAPFANGGFRVTPGVIASVSDPQGDVLEYRTFDRASVLDPALSYLMTSLLQSVVTDGTAGALGRRLGWTRSSAGKTGTTNGGRDAWFIGYTPELLAGVWVGEDSDRAIHAVGAKDALPIWAEFMKGALPEASTETFHPPQGGLVTVKIDPLSGLLAGSGCPQSREEVFLAGTEPKEYCPLHPHGIVGWFKRLFGSH